MTTQVVVETPAAANYEVEVVLQHRSGTVGGTAWEFDRLERVPPGEKRSWYLHETLRIATIEEVPIGQKAE